MKVIAIFALISLVYANPMPDGEQMQTHATALRERLQSSCPGRCLLQDKYRDWLINGIQKSQAWAEKVKADQTQRFIPNIPPEKFDQYCTEIGVIKTCVAACNDAADAEKKQKATAVLDSVKDLVCDADIKNKFACFSELSKTPSPQCDTQCQEFATPLMQTMEGAQAGQRDWAKAKEGAKAACQFVNCRLKCRKIDIVNKCEQSGYDAAKKTVQKLGSVGKTVHAQFRPAENFPAECNPDQLIQGA